MAGVAARGPAARKAKDGGASRYQEWHCSSTDIARSRWAHVRGAGRGGLAGYSSWLFTCSVQFCGYSLRGPSWGRLIGAQVDAQVPGDWTSDNSQTTYCTSARLRHAAFAAPARHLYGPGSCPPPASELRAPSSFDVQLQPFPPAGPPPPPPFAFPSHPMRTACPLGPCTKVWPMYPLGPRCTAMNTWV